MRKYQHRRESSCDTSDPRESVEPTEDSEYPTESGGTSTEDLTEVMDDTNGSVATTSEYSCVSNISAEPITLANSIDTTRAILKKKSLVQIINNYIRAGIEEGKRQAKKYIRKALSFGVKSGYLIPADPQGQVIRVSRSLAESRRADVESRRRRRRARRGEERLRTEERRREKDAPAKKTKPARDVSAEPALPSKRKRRSAPKSPAIRNLSLAKRSPRRTLGDPAAQRGNRRPRHTSTMKKGRESAKKGRGRDVQKERVSQGGSIRKRRAARSLSASKGEKDNRRSRRDRNERNRDSIKSAESEANQSAVVERRKSATRREDGAEARQVESLRNFERENDVEMPEETPYASGEREAIGEDALTNDYAV